MIFCFCIFLHTFLFWSHKFSKIKLNVIVALEIFRNFPSNYKSDFDEEDCISEYTNLRTNPDDDDDNAYIDDIRLPGPSEISKVLCWWCWY